MHSSQTMTSRQAAEKIGVHVRTIHRWIASGRLEAVKAPGYRGLFMIDPAEVAKLQEAAK